jgi:hypothetical protein
MEHWQTAAMRFAIILAILVAGPALSKTLLLQCTVAGGESVINLAAGHSGAAEGKLNPATIEVQIEAIGTFLFIGIDGPDDYRMALTSTPSDQNKVMGVLATENAFSLNTQDISDPKSSMTGNILINRMTGAIVVTKYFSVGNYYRNISYSGTCHKLSRTTNKF